MAAQEQFITRMPAELQVRLSKAAADLDTSASAIAKRCIEAQLPAIEAEAKAYQLRTRRDREAGATEEVVSKLLIKMAQDLRAGKTSFILNEELRGARGKALLVLLSSLWGEPDDEELAVRIDRVREAFDEVLGGGK